MTAPATKQLVCPRPDVCGCHWTYGELKHADWYTAWDAFAQDANKWRAAAVRIAAGPPTTLPNDEVASWAVSIAAEALT